MRGIKEIKEELEEVVRKVEKKKVKIKRVKKSKIYLDKPFHAKRRKARIEEAENLYKICLNEAFVTISKIREEIKNTEIYKRCEELIREVLKLTREITYFRWKATKLLSYFSREELAEVHTLVDTLSAELDFEGDFVTCNGTFKTLTVNYFATDESDVLTSWRTFDKISIRIDVTYPPGTCTIILFSDGRVKSKIELGVALVDTLYFLELYDVLADMCSKAHQKLQAKKKRCEEIMSEICKVAAPYILSEL